MINADMRQYNYYTYGTYNDYGQPILSDKPKGTIKMAINVITQGVEDNTLFENSTYIGLTQDEVNNTYVIQYEEERLKVLYVNRKGRYKQVYLARM